MPMILRPAGSNLSKITCPNKMGWSQNCNQPKEGGRQINCRFQNTKTALKVKKNKAWRALEGFPRRP